MEIVQKKTTLKGLVVSTLWKIWVSWGDEIPNIWKHNPDVPNHQPEFKSCLFKNGLHRVPLLCLIIGGSSHYLVHPDHKSSVWEVFWSQWGFTRFAHTKSAATDHHWLNHQLNVGYTGAIKKKIPVFLDDCCPFSYCYIPMIREPPQHPAFLRSLVGGLLKGSLVGENPRPTKKWSPDR